MTDSLLPGIPQRLDQHVTRIVAPNGGVMTGAGTNTYLVGADELVVIDPGPADESHVQAILNAAAGRRIGWILCTHTHVDHAPGTPRLKQLTGAKVGAMRAPLTDHDFNLEPDTKLRHDDSIQCGGAAIRAVHTPGHASNHLCFLLSNNGMLFTGDHIMQGSTVVIWPPDGNMRAYVESLRRLLTIAIKVLAPGHGHLIEDPHAEVDRLIRHRLRREDKIRKALLQAQAGDGAGACAATGRGGGAGGDVGAAQGATVHSLLPFTYDDVPEVLYEMAALSLRAHLDKLVEDGELRCADGRYSSVQALAR